MSKPEPKKVLMPVLPMEDLLDWADSLDVAADMRETTLNRLGALLAESTREKYNDEILRDRRRGAFLRRVAAAIMNAREAVEEVDGKEENGG